MPGVAGEMYAQCKTALRAFFRLRELSEDMRILSLNAELAAGRAGSAGVAVRALTQYTRQLVSQLNRVQEDMNTLQSDTEAMISPQKLPLRVGIPHTLTPRLTPRPRQLPPPPPKNRPITMKTTTT